MEFPLLIIFSAIAMDLLRRRTASWNAWSESAVDGTAFLLILLAVQWPFADFLVSPASANWVFGTKYLAYFASPNGFDARHIFFPIDQSAVQFWSVLAEAFVLAILSTRLGIAWGDWVHKIRR